MATTFLDLHYCLPRLVLHQVSAVTLQERIAELVAQHGSPSAAARVLQMDKGYFSRLACGEKSDPSDLFLRRMGLRRLVTYERVNKE